MIRRAIAVFPSLPLKPIATLRRLSEGECLFLNVKQGNDEPIVQGDRLYTGILSEFRSRSHTYLPHLTVGRLADTLSFQQALASVASLDVCLETEVTAVTVYRIEPEGVRPMESSVRLGARERGGVHAAESDMSLGA